MFFRVAGLKAECLIRVIQEFLENMIADRLYRIKTLLLVWYGSL